MKLITSIAALLGTAVVAHADPGIQLKNCIIDTFGARIIAETPWMQELIAEDPSSEDLMISGLIEGLMFVDPEDWTEMAGEDLSALRLEPATMLIERWIYDSAATCNQVTQ